MSVGGARNTVETVGELDGHYDGVIGAARAETSPNIEVRYWGVEIMPELPIGILAWFRRNAAF